MSIELTEPSSNDYDVMGIVGPSTNLTLQDLVAIGPAAARVRQDVRLAEPLPAGAPVEDALRYATRHAGTTLFEQKVGALWDAERRLIVLFNNHHHATQRIIMERTVDALRAFPPHLTAVARASFPERGDKDEGYTLAVALAGGVRSDIEDVRRIAIDMFGGGDGLCGAKRAEFAPDDPTCEAARIYRLAMPAIKKLLGREDTKDDCVVSIMRRSDVGPLIELGESVPDAPELVALPGDRAAFLRMGRLTPAHSPDLLKILARPAPPGMHYVVVFDGRTARVHTTVRSDLPQA